MESLLNARVVMAVLMVVVLACGGGGPQGVEGRPYERQEDRCVARGVALYNLTFVTYWSQDAFPKQYPLVRPPAQWSKVVGRTHNPDYQLWREGYRASAGLREFAETADTGTLDRETQGHNGVLDCFHTPNIPRGVGTQSTLVFMDAAHARVSLVSRVVPSPDWFVGLDSVSLCKGGEWLDERSVDLELHDAGTDQGFTFTAPNWEEVPHKAVERITAQYPSHPANSFYYPDLKRLPTIARAQFQLVRRYGDKENRKDVRTEESGDGQGADVEQRDVDASEKQDASIIAHEQQRHDNARDRGRGRETAQRRKEAEETVEENQTTPSPTTTVYVPHVRIQRPQLRIRKPVYQKSTPGQAERENNGPRQQYETRDRNALRTQSTRDSGKAHRQQEKVTEKVRHRVTQQKDAPERYRPGSRDERREGPELKQTLGDDSLTGRKLNPALERRPGTSRQSVTPRQAPSDRYRYRGSDRYNRRHRQRKQGGRNTHHHNDNLVGARLDRNKPRREPEINRGTGPAHCEVSDWTDWTPCSKTCGFGTQVRLRTVRRRPQNGGSKCPLLTESKLCGSMRGCGWSHFSSSRWSRKSRS